MQIFNQFICNATSSNLSYWLGKPLIVKENILPLFFLRRNYSRGFGVKLFPPQISKESPGFFSNTDITNVRIGSAVIALNL